MSDGRAEIEVEPPVDSTVNLLARYREGDDDALDRLLARYLPALRRMARGRVPSRARHLANTDDIVQETFCAALKGVDSFEPRHPGAFFAYLGRILRNKVLDQVRTAARRPGAEELPESAADHGASPLVAAIEHEKWESYARALEKLPDQQQAAVFLRLEAGLSYTELADAIGSPSPDAARMMVTRAIRTLVEVMDE